MTHQMPLSDQAFMNDFQFREALIRDYKEAYKQGSDGHVVDSRLTLTHNDWGFRLRDIDTPVYLWHGEEDTLVSKNMATHMAKELPNCSTFFIQHAGHILLDRPDVVDKIQEILKTSA